MSQSPLQSEIEHLRRQLAEANETIEAIRSGSVDAFMIDFQEGSRVYSLEGSDRPYRLLVEKMQQGAVTLSDNGAIAFCNLYFSNLIGMPHERMIGSLLDEFVKKEDLPNFRKMLREARSGSCEAELELQLADGSSNPVQMSFNLLPEESGVTFGVLVSDLKPRKEQEELHGVLDILSESEAQLRQLANSIPQLAFTAKADGDVDWYNNRWYEYTGTNLKSMRGWGWQSVHEPTTLPRVVKKWKHSLETGTPFEMTFPLRGADGNFRPFLTRVIPVRDNNNEIIRWFGTSTDISKERETQEKLRNIAARLSEADRRKDEFLATLAHELRNPLSPIKTATELMQIAEDDVDELRELSSVIDRQVNQMVRLIDDLLDVSRISRGKITLRSERCNLHQVMENAVEAAQPFISSSNHTFHVDYYEHPLYIMGDQVRLVQVLVNLLNNAGKYTPVAGEIWLSLHKKDEDALLVVRDNGIGLAPEQLTRVFELFEQVDISKERGQAGLGIGLSLVKTLVELHGGQVRAESEGAGTGSRFEIRLPLIAEPEKTIAKPPEGVKQSLGRKLKVLVVEDTAAIRFMMTRLLEKMGHQAFVAEHGEMGIETALAVAPDVIFSDISMPVMNGHEMARKIRTDQKLKEIPLVALTGFGQEADRQNAIDSGFDDHLVKPVDARVLSDLLNKLNVSCS